MDSISIFIGGMDLKAIDKYICQKYLIQSTDRELI